MWTRGKRKCEHLEIGHLCCSTVEPGNSPGLWPKGVVRSGGFILFFLPPPYPPHRGQSGLRSPPPWGGNFFHEGLKTLKNLRFLMILTPTRVRLTLFLMFSPLKLLGVLLCSFWSHLKSFWRLFGAILGPSCPPEALWSHLGSILTHFSTMLLHLGALRDPCYAHPEATFVQQAPLWVHVDAIVRLGTICGGSRGHLGAIWKHFGAILGVF